MRYLILILCAILMTQTGCSRSRKTRQDPQRKPLTAEQNPVKKGLQLYKSGDLEESEVVFKNILKQDQGVLIAKEMLAVINFNQNEYREAEKFAYNSKGMLSSNLEQNGKG